MGSGSGSGNSDDKSRTKFQDLSSVCAVGMRWEKQLPDSSEGSKRLSLAESKELLRCEELLPLQALIAYRQQAVTETLLRAYERSINAADSNSTSGTSGTGIGVGASTVTVTGSTKDATSSKSNAMAMAMAMGATTHGDGGMNGSPYKHAPEKKKSVASSFKKLFSYKKEKVKEKENKKDDSRHHLNREREMPEVTRSLDDEGIGTHIGTGGELSVVDKNESRSNRRNPFVKMGGLFRSNKDLKLDIDPNPTAAATATASMRIEEAMDDLSLEFLASELLSDVNNTKNNISNNISSTETRAGGGAGQGQGPVQGQGKEAEGESFFPLRLRLSACVSVTLSDVAPLVMVQVACGGDVTATSVNDLKVDCYVQELLIEDLVTVTPVKRTLLSFASTAPTHTSAAPVPHPAKDMKSDSCMSKIRVLYESSGLTSSSLRISCQPIEVAINVLCLERLSELAAARVARLLKVIATFGENDYLRKTAEWGAEGVITAQTAANMAGQVAEAIVGDGMEIAVEVRSNKIFLPHCSSRDEGCFVLDLGRAVLNGGYSMESGLSLRLDVTDLCAGIMPSLPLPSPLPLPLNHRPTATSTSTSTSSPPPRSSCSAGTQTMIEYLLHPVDAYLTFLTPGEEKERGEVKEKEKEKGPTIAFRYPSHSSSSFSTLHSSAVCVTSDNTLPIIYSRLRSKLLIELKLQSGLQIILTPPKLVQIVQYSRIFISFVWTVNNVFCLHLGSPAKCIADEKLAEGLHYLNNVLNPTMKSSQTRDNKGNSNSNSNSNSSSNSNSNSNNKGKNSTTSRVSPSASTDKKAVKRKGISKGKRKGKTNGSLSEMFSKIVQNISGTGSGTGTGTGSASRTDKEAGIGRGAGAEATRAGELSTHCICI